MKHPIYPCLWFDGKAEAAADFYCAVFNNAKVLSKNPVAVNIAIADQKFLCLNGGPEYSPNPSISFFVLFTTEKETQECWDKLTESGKILMELDKYDWSPKYGWVEDKFGISWQLSTGKFEDVGQTVTTSLMFTQQYAGKAEEAMKFYTSLFDNSDITGFLKYGKDDIDVEGTIKHAQFKLNSQVFMAMDSSAAHKFTFNEGISLVIECENQREIDFYWDKLSENGSESMCGWLKDQYGVSWQVVPEILGSLMSDPSKIQKIMPVFMKMKKFDIAALEKAAV